MKDYELEEDNLIYMARLSAMNLLGGFFDEKNASVEAIHCGAEQLVAMKRGWA